MSRLKLNDLIPDNVEFYPEAAEDFLSLDKGRQIKVIKALQKISRAPSQYGKLLENQGNRPLAGFRSIYVDKKSIRIIWKVTETGFIQIAVVAGIAERDGMLAYKLVSERKESFDMFLKKIIDEM
ncbi:MAG: hypothetical protein HPY74_17340 [Firmicutes bacterium]|nr:hypothetical protein [Bacillota bacterium]